MMKGTLRVLLASMLVMACNNSWAVSAEGDIAVSGFGTTRDGEELLPENLRGQVVLATYWVSWCGYCRKAMADFASFQQVAKDHGLKVVFINHKEDRDIFRNAERSLRKYDVLMAHDRKGNYGDAYGVDSYPHILLLDKDGTVVRSSSGYGANSKNFYAKAIAKLLEGEAATTSGETAVEAVMPAPATNANAVELDRSTHIETPAIETEMDLTVPVP
ncbi:MAG: TlpA family protein disulfide reductase [Permianibacter sp.]